MREGACIFFHAEVCRATVLRLARLLREAAAEAVRASAPGSPPAVTLFIHSCGGDLFEGLSAMAHIANCAVPVTTVVDGFAASAATFLLLAARRRLATPHARILIHQVRTGFWGKWQELQDEVRNTDMIMSTMRQIYLETTRMSARRIERTLRREMYLDAAEALRLGLVHGLWQPAAAAQ